MKQRVSMSAPDKTASNTMKVGFPSLISVIYVDNNTAILKQRTTAKEFREQYTLDTLRYNKIYKNTMNLTVTKYERGNDLRRKFRGMI